MANGAQAAGGFLLLLLLTRLLSTTSYGIYAIILSTVTLLESAFFGWITSAVLRYLPEHNDGAERAELVSPSFVISCCLVATIGGLMVAASFLATSYGHELRMALRLGALLLGARVGFGFTMAILRANRQTSRYAVDTVVVELASVFLAGVVLLTVAEGSVAGVLVAVTAATALVALAELFRMRALCSFRRPVLRSTVVKRAFSYGAPLAGASLGSMILSVGDRYMLQYLRGSAEVGLYSASYDVADKSLRVLFTVLVAAAFPVVMEVVAEKGREGAGEVVGRVIGVYVFWMVPLTVLLISMRTELGSMVLGPRFAGATAVIPWVAIGTLLWGLAQVVAQDFQIYERTSPLLYWLLASAGLNVGLNLVLIPPYGLVGAGAATAMAYAFYLAVLCVFNPRSGAGTAVGASLVKPAIAGVATYLVATALPTHGVADVVSAALKLAVGLTVYMTVLATISRTSVQQAFTDARAWIRR